MIASLLQDRRGVSAVEFALTVPLFLAIVVGMIQLGQMLWRQSALQHAVDMGARCASINPALCGTAAAIQTYAASQSYGLTFPAGTFVSTTAACGAQVAASYYFSFGAALLPALTIPLTARSCYAP